MQLRPLCALFDLECGWTFMFWRVWLLSFLVEEWINFFMSERDWFLGYLIKEWIKFYCSRGDHWFLSHLKTLLNWILYTALNVWMMNLKGCRRKRTWSVSQHLPQDKPRTPSAKTASIRAEIRTQDPPKTKHDYLSIRIFEQLKYGTRSSDLTKIKYDWIQEAKNLVELDIFRGPFVDSELCIWISQSAFFVWRLTVRIFSTEYLTGCRLSRCL